MVVRIKDFERRNMPEHWVSSMLKLSGRVYRIHETYHSGNGWPIERVRLKEPHVDIVLVDYFFCPEDFEKVNINAPH